MGKTVKQVAHQSDTDVQDQVEGKTVKRVAHQSDTDVQDQIKGKTVKRVAHQSDTDVQTKIVGKTVKRVAHQSDTDVQEKTMGKTIKRVTHQFVKKIIPATGVEKLPINTNTLPSASQSTSPSPSQSKRSPYTSTFHTTQPDIIDIHNEKLETTSEINASDTGLKISNVVSLEQFTHKMENITPPKITKNPAATIPTETHTLKNSAYNSEKGDEPMGATPEPQKIDRIYGERGIFRCKLCSFVATGSFIMKRHEEAHTDPSRYCHKCNRAYERRTDLSRHNCKVKCRNGNKRQTKKYAGILETTDCVTTPAIHTEENNMDSFVNAAQSDKSHVPSLSIIPTKRDTNRSAPLAKNKSIVKALGTFSLFKEKYFSNRLWGYCRICSLRCRSRKELRSHLQSIHEFDIRHDSVDNYMRTKIFKLICSFCPDHKMFSCPSPLKMTIHMQIAHSELTIKNRIHLLGRKNSHNSLGLPEPDKMSSIAVCKREPITVESIRLDTYESGILTNTQVLLGSDNKLQEHTSCFKIDAVRKNIPEVSCRSDLEHFSGAIKDKDPIITKIKISKEDIVESEDENVDIQSIANNSDTASRFDLPTTDPKQNKINKTGLIAKLLDDSMTIPKTTHTIQINKTTNVINNSVEELELLKFTVLENDLHGDFESPANLPIRYRPFVALTKLNQYKKSAHKSPRSTKSPRSPKSPKKTTYKKMKNVKFVERIAKCITIRASDEPGDHIQNLGPVILCPVCVYLSETKDSLLHHLSSHISMRCKLCKKTYTKAEDLLEHWFTHPDFQIERVKYKCDVCDFSSITRQKVLSHRSHHFRRALSSFTPPMPQAPSSFNLPKPEYIPVVKTRCGRVTTGIVENVLSDQISVPDNLISKEKPDIDDDASNKDPSLSCTLCGVCFKSPLYLNKHAVMHTNERPFACTLCDATFQTYQSLGIHKRVIHKSRKKRQRTTSILSTSKSLSGKNHVDAKGGEDLLSEADTSFDTSTDCVNEEDDGPHSEKKARLEIIDSGNGINCTTPDNDFELQREHTELVHVDDIIEKVTVPPTSNTDTQQNQTEENEDSADKFLNSSDNITNAQLETSDTSNNSACEHDVSDSSITLNKLYSENFDSAVNNVMDELLDVLDQTGFNEMAITDADDGLDEPEQNEVNRCDLNPAPCQNLNTDIATVEISMVDTDNMEKVGMVDTDNIEKDDNSEEESLGGDNIIDSCNAFNSTTTNMDFESHNETYINTIGDGSANSLNAQGEALDASNNCTLDVLDKLSEDISSSELQNNELQFDESSDLEKGDNVKDIYNCAINERMDKSLDVIDKIDLSVKIITDTDDLEKNEVMSGDLSLASNQTSNTCNKAFTSLDPELSPISTTVSAMIDICEKPDHASDLHKICLSEKTSPDDALAQLQKNLNDLYQATCENTTICDDVTSLGPDKVTAESAMNNLCDTSKQPSVLVDQTDHLQMNINSINNNPALVKNVESRSVEESHMEPEEMDKKIENRLETNQIDSNNIGSSIFKINDSSAHSPCAVHDSHDPSIGTNCTVECDISLNEENNSTTEKKTHTVDRIEVDIVNTPDMI